VCAWVGAQSFRAYKHIFREGLISGRTLLALDHAILEVSCFQGLYLASRVIDGLICAEVARYGAHSQCVSTLSYLRSVPAVRACSNPDAKSQEWRLFLPLRISKRLKSRLGPSRRIR
jgi:hypothetical protein